MPRAEHSISRSQISQGTLKVLYTLKDAGYEAYMVGGGVRDLLAGLEPKDFDIATNAHPDQVKAIFRSCRLVGRRFVICHVRHGNEISEVTTFRGPITDEHERDDTGRILNDNEYGTLEEDAFRRDFTINALYYDIRDFSIIDFADGLTDMKRGVIRLIGDPELRYREDAVRMLRAVRIANKMNFKLDGPTAKPIPKLAPLLAEIPAARLFDEVLKVMLNKQAVNNFLQLRELGLFAQLFPQTEKAIEDARSYNFVVGALLNTADRMKNDASVSPAFFYAALLWPPVVARMRDLIVRQNVHPNVASVQACEEVLAMAVQRIAIPKRFSLPMREIWQMQPRFEMRKGGRAKRLLTHPRFRAAYDFLLLRAQAGEAPKELADWWTQAQVGTQLPPVREEAVDSADGPVSTEGAAPVRKRRRRGGRRNKKPTP
ncbi:polynucleotide adenylyltransferase PcnB [Stenotrophobium rhamnosiphilum]|uniref:polynucleotide adenylyltransferase PcnB n=1 Tax=Stenotrophobium rhamnosiphilum TaxID=2029166 RepID=UPI0023E76734|nr:polynucleotide adenylyltransferase PcnB [Stenotrophobium rhamnosiphilum]